MKNIMLCLSVLLLLPGCAARYQAMYPLHNAVYNNDTGKMQELLNSGTPTNTRDNAGLMPIHIAATQHTIDPALLLIKKGVDVNARSASGNTSIQIAVKSCNPGMVKLFANSGAKTNINNEGNTLMHSVSQCPDMAEEISTMLALLLPMGIDLTTINNAGKTPYFIAMEYMNMEMIAVLRSRGVTETYTPSDGFSEALRRPSFYTPPSGSYKYPAEKEGLYKLAVADCNHYAVTHKKGLLLAGGPIGYGLGLAFDQVKVPKKFNACMKVMGFTQL